MPSVWLDGKQHVATVEQTKSKWGGIGFACALCGHKFAAGDTYRWVYMNGANPSPGNFLVCPSCDVPGLSDKIRAALSQDKPHLEEWVLLYLLDQTKRAAEKENERER